MFISTSLTIKVVRHNFPHTKALVSSSSLVQTWETVVYWLANYTESTRLTTTVLVLTITLQCFLITIVFQWFELSSLPSKLEALMVWFYCVKNQLNLSHASKHLQLCIIFISYTLYYLPAAITEMFGYYIFIMI